MNLQQFIEVSIGITVLYGAAVFVLAKGYRGKKK